MPVHTRNAKAFSVWHLMLLLGVSACAPGAYQKLPSASISSIQKKTLIVSAAASVTDALEEIRLFYQQAHPNVEVIYNFGSSGALQRQIEQGAPVNVFISAAPQPINVLERKGLLVAGTRKNLLANQIVLIARKDSYVKGFQDLALPSVARVAVGDPGSVPAGIYAKQVLTTLKLWELLRPKLVLAKDVRQVLSYVATGNVDAGIVYLTDAQASKRVRVVAIAPPSSHEPVIYPVAIIKDSQNIPAAQSFVEFLFNTKAKAVFEKYGFAIAPSQ